MILDHPLTPEQRQKSQFNYNCFNIVNGASYMCLGESVIVLFAVKLDMPNTVISLIGALQFLGYLLLPFGVWRTAVKGAAQCQADFWVCRNIAVLLVAASVLVNLYSSTLACLTLLLGGFLFYGFRAAGCIMASPLMGDITTDEERPGLIAKSVSYFYGFGALALGTISIILHFNDSLTVLVSVIIAGAALGITSSKFLRNIDETSLIRKSARLPIFRGFSYIWTNSTIFKLICAWFLYNLTVLMIVPMSLLAVKRGFSVSDTNAILFSLAQFFIMILGSHAGIPLTKKAGPRKVIIYGFLLFIPTLLFWILIPVDSTFSGLGWLILLIPFAAQGIACVLVSNALTHYFLMAVPKRKQVGASMLICLLTAAAAGVLGMLMASGGMKLAEKIAAVPGMPVFHWYFIIASAIVVISLPFLLRLDTVLHSFKEAHGEEGLDKTVTLHRPGEGHGRTMTIPLEDMTEEENQNLTHTEKEK